ncbi:MAG: orotate phosphoribosyltransferase [Gemmatimonadota bacterium]
MTPEIPSRGDGHDGSTDWLARLRERGALLEGHFRLSSGLHSPHYVQCALFLQHPEDAGEAAESLVARLLPSLGEPPDAVVSPAIGGLVLGHELGRAFGCRAIWAERGEDGALGFRRGFRLAPGERVVLAEDVVTTAGSLRELIRLAAVAGAHVVGVACLVDRSGGRASWDVPYASLVRLDGVQVPPAECAPCAEGVPVQKPGSRPEA